MDVRLQEFWAIQITRSSCSISKQVLSLSQARARLSSEWNNGVSAI